MRSLTGSQCRSIRIGVMWSCFRIPVIRRAAAFWTYWSFEYLNTLACCCNFLTCLKSLVCLTDMLDFSETPHYGATLSTSLCFCSERYYPWTLLLETAYLLCSTWGFSVLRFRPFFRSVSRFFSQKKLGSLVWCLLRFTVSVLFRSRSSFCGKNKI